VLLAKSPKMRVADFLDGPIRSYFFGQHHLKYEDVWPFSELKHRFDGLVQAYATFLGCPEDPKIVKGLLVLLGQKWKRGRHFCPCGSGLKVRNCCRVHLDGVPKKRHYMTISPMLDRFNLYQA